MNAVVLAGGFGSRLKPLTDDCPKPMLPVVGRPMLDYTVAQLHAFGIDRIMFTLGYKAEQILRFISGYASVEAGYYIETTPLGTCGGVKAACGACGSTFFVLSGDALSNIDLAELAAHHHASGAQVTMAVVRVTQPSLYGVVEADARGTVTRFVEKPKRYRGEAWVNSGVYCINKSILDYVPENCKFDFSRDLFPVLVASGELSAYRHEGYWSDIGDVGSYYRSNFDMLSGGFYPFIKNPHINALHGPDAAGSAYDAHATINGACNRSIVGNAIIEATGAVDGCIVMDGAVVRDKRRNSIIGADFTVPVTAQPNFVENPSIFFEKQL